MHYHTTRRAILGLALLAAGAAPALAAPPSLPDSFDVEVVNTPDVIVKNTPGVTVENVPTVKVDSSLANPVFVQDAAPPQSPKLVRDRMPFGTTDVTALEVPAGRVMTDFVITADVEDPDGICVLEIVGGEGFSMLIPVKNDLTHIGLESGLDTGVDGMTLYRYVASSACGFGVVYTGYEY